MSFLLQELSCSASPITVWSPLLMPGDVKDQTYTPRFEEMMKPLGNPHFWLLCAT